MCSSHRRGDGKKQDGGVEKWVGGRMGRCREIEGVSTEMVDNWVSRWRNREMGAAGGGGF